MLLAPLLAALWLILPYIQHPSYHVFPHQLIPDILSQHVHTSSRNLDMLSTALETHNYTALTKADLYSHLTVDLSSDGLAISMQLLDRIERDEELCNYVKRIKVTDGESQGGPPSLLDASGIDPDAVIYVLGMLLNEGRHPLENLEAIEWDTQENWPGTWRLAPNCTLSLPKYTGYPMRPTPALTHLDVSLDKDDLWEDLGLSIRVQRLIFGSRNLKSLHFNILPTGCYVYDDFEFNTWVPGRFPDLEELAFQGYSFTEQGVRYLREAMNWSRLHTLKIGHECSPTPFLDYMAPLLPSLKNLDIVIPYIGQKEAVDAAQKFLSLVPGLDQLKVEGSYGPLVEGIVRHHCPSLRRLELHDPEFPQDDDLHFPPRPTLTAEELTTIGRLCPHLEELSVDLNQTDGMTWPQEHIDVLLSREYFPSLRTLTIHSLLGLRWDRTPPMPDENDCKSLLLQMLPMSEIRKFKVMIGEWDRFIGSGFPSPWISMEKGAKTMCSTTEVEKGGRVLIETFSAKSMENITTWDPHSP